MKGNLGSIETKAIHAGEPRPRIAGAVVMPVFQSATYQYAGEKNYDDVRYIRLNNTPNHLALAEKLSALENAEDALVTASGMAAISTSLLTFLGKGDHFLAQDCLYGGTHDFVTRDLEKFGISYDFIDGNDPESWKRKLKPSTKAIYVETISNPLMQVPDLESVVTFAKSHGLVSMIDNTFATAGCFSRNRAICTALSLWCFTRRASVLMPRCSRKAACGSRLPPRWFSL